MKRVVFTRPLPPPVLAALCSRFGARQVSVMDSRIDELPAAGFDVFSAALHPPYLGLPNVTLLPHIGSATVETRIRMGERVLANVEIFLAGRRAPDLIDRRNDVPRLQHAAT
jgi:hypothetical protein